MKYAKKVCKRVHRTIHEFHLNNGSEFIIRLSKCLKRFLAGNTNSLELHKVCVHFLENKSCEMLNICYHHRKMPSYQLDRIQSHP